VWEVAGEMRGGLRLSGWCEVDGVFLV
jgi:hypothetical protein